MQPLLEGIDISAGYGAVPAVHDISLAVHPGEVVALLGANGAGKSTTLLSLSGVLPLTAGEVRLFGEPTSTASFKRARSGLAFMPGGRTVFVGLSTAENLRLGRGSVDAALEIFPELERLLNRKAGLLSGGEQQMVSLARALAAEPRVLMLDELSLGLAPMIVDRLYEVVKQFADRGMAVLIVEQHLSHALRLADRAYVMRRGTVVLHGTSEDLRNRIPEVEAAYLSREADEVVSV